MPEVIRTSCSIIHPRFLQSSKRWICWRNIYSNIFGGFTALSARTRTRRCLQSIVPRDNPCASQTDTLERWIWRRSWRMRSVFITVVCQGRSCVACFILILGDPQTSHAQTSAWHLLEFRYPCLALLSQQLTSSGNEFIQNCNWFIRVRICCLFAKILRHSYECSC